MRRARGSPPTGSSPAPSGSGLRGVPAIPALDVALRGTRGRPPAHATHTLLPRMEARAEVSQGSEDTARPRLALGEVSGSLFYSASRFIAGGGGSRTGGGKSASRH